MLMLQVQIRIMLNVFRDIERRFIAVWISKPAVFWAKLLSVPSIVTLICDSNHPLLSRVILCAYGAKLHKKFEDVFRSITLA